MVYSLTRLAKLFMKEKDRKYEMLLILKSSLPENVRSGIQSKVEKIMEDTGMSLEKRDVWGKKYLSYPVKKHKEGYFVFYNLIYKNFSGDDFEKAMKAFGIIPEILRIGFFNVNNFSEVPTVS